MSAVHNEISKKVKEKVDAIETYKQMDLQRESIISQLMKDYQSANPIELSLLNNWTKEMNQFAQKHQLPLRKYVSMEMFIDYISRLN